MPDGPIDPASLEGDDLTRWYLRSPDEIEQERQDAAAQQYQSFFGQTDPDPGIEGQPYGPLEDVDPGLSRGSDAPTKDVDPAISWIHKAPTRGPSKRPPEAPLSAPLSVSPFAAATTAASQLTPPA